VSTSWWLHFLLAVVTGGFAASMAEWLFSGDLWLPLYRRHPEVWRSSEPNYSEKTGIAFSTAYAFVSAAIFFLLLHLAAIHDWRLSILTALLMWLMVPLPLLFTLSYFMKYPRALAVVHATGWLVKLLLFALAAIVFRL